MVRLVEHDRRLANGCILPLPPPSPDLNITKRSWEALIRKWRRALHMFDHVFIDGVDDPSTFEDVIEAQRKLWLSDASDSNQPRRVLDYHSLIAVRDSPTVPSKIPVEDELVGILRSPQCFDRSVAAVVQQESPQHASTMSRVRHMPKMSPTSFGIRLMLSADSN